MNVQTLALVALLTATPLFGQSAAQPVLPTVSLKIGSHTVTAEVADDDGERSAGLMFRESLPVNHGMLFIMPTIGPAAFWMKNTSLPLTIAFIEADGTIAEIHDLEPFNERPVPSRTRRIAYALEMNRGWFTKNNVWPGERVRNLPPHPLALPR